MRDFFIADWRRILLFGYSSIAAYLLLGTYLTLEAIFLLTGVDYDPYVIGPLLVAIFLLIPLLRIVRQERKTRLFRYVVVAVLLLLYGGTIHAAYAMGQRPSAPPDTPRVATESASLWDQVSAIARPLVVRWEGSHKCKDGSGDHCVYLDRIADPDVATGCYGATGANIKMGMRFSEAQCQALLDQMLHAHWDGWMQAVTIPRADIPITVHAAGGSLTYNIGIGAARRASMTQAINRRDCPDACRRMTFYNKAGKRVIPGLVNRRADEHAVCVGGL